MTCLFEELGRDIRFAVRQAVRHARFWSVLFVTLVVGIASSTTIYAVADGVLFKPLPYPEPDRLVELRTWQYRGEYAELARRAQSSSATPTTVNQRNCSPSCAGCRSSLTKRMRRPTGLARRCA